MEEETGVRHKPVLLVTGSTRGLGAGWLGALASEGVYRLVLHGRSAEGVAKALDEFERTYPESECLGVVADLRDVVAIEAMFEQIQAQFETPPTVVIHNAGIMGSAVHRMHELPPELWREVMDVNVQSCFLLHRVAVRAWLAAEIKGAKICYISSGATQRSGADPTMHRLGAYALSKHAVEAFARQAADEVFADEIGVCCLSIDASYPSEMTRSFLEEREFARLPQIAELHPLFVRMAAAPWDEVTGKRFSSQRYLDDPAMEWMTASPFSRVEMVSLPMLIPEKKKFLCSGENHLGPSPRVTQFLQSQALQLERYPRSWATLELRRELAKRIGVEENMILVGNGIVSCLESVLKLFVPRRHHVIAHRAGWDFFFRLLEARDLHVTTADITIEDKDCDFHSEQILAQVSASTRLVYLTNPNNPTGRLMKPEEIEQLLDALPATMPVVIDECYHDYVSRENPAQVAKLLQRTQRPIIGLRTLSKFYGLANLRIGYAVAHPEVIRAMQHTHLPWTISDLNARCATEALRDLDYQAERREAMRVEREFLHEALEAAGVDFLPSDSMMMLLSIPNGDFFALRQALSAHEIVVAPMAFQKKFVYQIGSRYHNQRLVEAMTTLGSD